MTEPWNLKKDDRREADSIPTFIIFCEDEVSEPVYFKYFETPLIKINPVEGQKSKIENVVKAISHCVDQKLMKVIDGVSTLISDDIQVWCVFDRDANANETTNTANILFNEAIETAKNRGFKVAWSNDSFELWILLHFMDIDPDLPESKLRVTYYDNLTEFFKNVPKPNEYLKNVLKAAGFNYKKHLKSRKNFRNIVRDEMIHRTQDAIDRAKVLEEYHSNANKENHEKNPYTLVHHLISELIRLGKKPMP